MSKGDVGGLPCVINGQEQLVFVPGFVDINYLNIPDKNASDHFYETIMDTSTSLPRLENKQQS